MFREGRPVLVNGVRLDKEEVEIPSPFSDYYDQSKIVQTNLPGRRISIGYTKHGATTVTGVANTMYAIPFVIKRPLNTSALAYQVANYVSNGLVRVGLYTANKINIYPDRLINECEVNAIANGIYTIDFKAKLDTGLHFLAHVNSTATFGCPGFPEEAIIPVLGIDSTIPTTADFRYRCYQISYTYGALPLIFPTGATKVSSSYNQRMFPNVGLYV